MSLLRVALLPLLLLGFLALQPARAAGLDDIVKAGVLDIDKPGVKVIANPGGSNERFAKANFKNATVTIHTDNITIFDEVLKGNADVFVTESAETIIQQRQKPGLCGVNPDKPLQYGEMAYMLPRGDVVTKDYIDQWLHLTKATGEYQRIVARWL